MANEKRLIDANALIHRLVVDRDEVEIKTGCDIGYHNGLNMAVSMAINAPTVDTVEVVHGRWVAKETMIRSPFAKNYYCSECQTEGSPQWKRCPVCEAKMDGGNADGICKKN